MSDLFLRFPSTPFILSEANTAYFQAPLPSTLSLDRCLNSTRSLSAPEAHTQGRAAHLHRSVGALSEGQREVALEFHAWMLISKDFCFVLSQIPF